MRKGAAASLITLACHPSSGQPDRLNMSPLAHSCSSRGAWVFQLQPDIYSTHSQASELTSSSEMVWL